MSIFSDLKPTNHTARNGFDLGRFSTFSTKAGYILPVFNQATIPDGEYSLDIKQLLRTQPLQKAAFTGFSVNYDIIWSPYNHLYSSFNQFIAQRENKNLSVQPTMDTIPTFNLGGFVRNIFCFALYDYIFSFIPHDQFSTVDDAYGFMNWVSIRDDHNPDESVALNVLRNLDMMGYGNYLPLLKNTYKTLTGYSRFQYDPADQSKLLAIHWTELTEAITPDPDTNIPWTGVLGFFEYVLGVDLRDPDALTGINMQQFVTDVMMPFFDNDKTWWGHEHKLYPTGSIYPLTGLLHNLLDSQVNLFVPLAYNKAFYEYYRNSYYDNDYNIVTVFGDDDERSLRYDYVQLFNMDDNPDLGYYNKDSDIYYDPTLENMMRLVSIFNVKPHLYKRDMFTGVMPSTQFGDVSMMFTDTDFHNIFTNIHDSSNVPLKSGNIAVAPVQGNSRSDVFGATVNSTYSSIIGEKFRLEPALAISVLESRRADAMQRFKERMMRAGDKTKDIFKAHGWSEPKSELSFEPIFLGSFDGRLDINVVAATSESENVELAQLGANGMCTVSGSKVKIKTSDFGVLFVLMHIEKDAVYDSYGLDVAHTLNEAFDYPYPVLQNISLAPVDRKFLNVIDNRSADDVRDIIGFLPRAIGFKTALDKIHGEFYSSAPYQTTSLSWVPGAFSDWVSPREDILDFAEKSFLYVSPHCVDTIFKMQSNVRQESDQFFINCRFDCYAVEPLPVIGLPI